MDLHEYPRPANDTGIGIHWCPGYATAIGLGRIRSTWLPELRSLGVKWVKIYNHDGALDFAELLLAEGMMPIVRIYRPAPNPGRFSLREIVYVDSFIRAGVRYFEFNSEPDRDAEWKGGRVPSNGLELVADDSIANLEAILERGGMPGIPAIANGGSWDLVGKIVAKGRRDLFDGPVWQAIHNYTRNRPLDFPYDIGNQEGAAYTERFYRTVADEPWEENAWRGRSLTEVNRLRLDRCSPGATIADDHGCWLAFEHFDALNRRHLGRSLPILATESGYLVGEDADPRYPATTPNLHMAQTLEACRVLMGSSTRFPAAPDYLFCACFSVIANNQMSSPSAWWEKFAWYSATRPGGALPTVRALRAETKSVRKRQGAGAGGPLITLSGVVLNATEQHTVTLERNGIQVASTVIDANHRYTLPDQSPGAYLLRIQGANLEQPVTLSADQQQMVVNLDLGALADGPRRSNLNGRVRGGAGAVVTLLRAQDGEEWVTMAQEDGSYRFVDLPAGIYSLRVTPEGSHVEGIALDGRNQREIDLALAGWGYSVTTAEQVEGIGAIRCRISGQTKVTMQAHSFSGSSEPVQTGSDPGLAEDECQLGPFDTGLYIVTASGLTDASGRTVEPEARVTVDKRRIPLVEFVYSELQTSAPTSASTISGKVVGGESALGTVRIRLTDTQAHTQEIAIGADGAFTFSGLGAGRYALELVGAEEQTRRADIALDGVNQVAIELVTPVTLANRSKIADNEQSTITGRLPGDAVGRKALLVDAVGNERRTTVETDGTVSFAQLPAGVFTLSVDGGYVQSDLQVDGMNGVDVAFAPVNTVWQVQVSKAGAMPGYAVVRVEVQGQRNTPVYIWKDDWPGMMKRAGSSPEHGEFALEFSPLAPGVYMVEPDGLGVHATVELSTGLEIMWVSFSPAASPMSPNDVRTIAAPVRAVAATESTRAEAVRSRLYLWLDHLTARNEELVKLARFVARATPAVGADFAAAALSDQVIILEDAQSERSEEHGQLQSQLTALGVVVRRATIATLGG